MTMRKHARVLFINKQVWTQKCAVLDLQTILVQDQMFHICNHAQEVMQLLALEYVQLTISLFGTKI
jgi:hypothetical protein